MIAIVVPTIRDMTQFLEKWQRLILKYQAEIIIVRDGDKPYIQHRSYDLKEFEDLVFNKSDCCRNLGFAYVAKYLPKVDTIFTFDDDISPIDGQDPIGLHLKALNTRFPLSWMSTASKYVRGVPYGVRDEAECVVSHGVWRGVKDWDAPTQLIKGNPKVTFYKGAIPRGVYFPFCGMNVAFKRKMLPYMYYAPMGHKVGLDRFADIWLGINLKRVCDDNDWAIATGYSKVIHNRASNVWKNLQKEARGLELNETYWKGEENDDYFKIYKTYRQKWKKMMEQYA